MAVGILNSLIPITQFNRGQAAKIFDRLRTEKRLIVLKNNQPSAVILSPEEYERLAEIEENYRLLIEADKRLKKNEGMSSLPMDQVLNDLGISEEELSDGEDVNFE